MNLVRDGALRKASNEEAKYEFYIWWGCQAHWMSLVHLSNKMIHTACNEKPLFQTLSDFDIYNLIKSLELFED